MSKQGVFFPFLLMKTGDSQDLNWNPKNRQQHVSCFLPVLLPPGILSCWAQPLTLLHPPSAHPLSFSSQHSASCPLGQSVLCSHGLSLLPLTFGPRPPLLSVNVSVNPCSGDWGLRIFAICNSLNLGPHSSFHNSRDRWWDWNGV